MQAEQSIVLLHCNHASAEQSIALLHCNHASARMCLHEGTKTAKYALNPSPLVMELYLISSSKFFPWSSSKACVSAVSARANEIVGQFGAAAVGLRRTQ